MKVNKFTTTNPRGEEVTFDDPETMIHPKGKIKLLDGREIDGFPRKTPIQVADNTLSLDTSGVYFIPRRKKRSIKREDEAVKAERERKERLFYENAFFFFMNRERILSDSRMFLAPVDVESAIAITGKSGFHRPTLGVYIEYWKNCIGGRVVDDDASPLLIWFIAGSPLSGQNCCSAVDEKGISHVVSVSPFMQTWKSFVSINTRYDECKSKFEAYTLEEVLTILHREQNNP